MGVLHIEETLLKTISIFKEQQQAIHTRLNDIVSEDIQDKFLRGRQDHTINMLGAEHTAISDACNTPSQDARVVSQVETLSMADSSQQDADEKTLQKPSCLTREASGGDRREGWCLFRRCQRRSSVA